MKQVRAEAHRFTGTFKYLAIANHASGVPNRYDVFIETADNPVIIGRELPLDFVKQLIKKYERHAKDSGTVWFGDRDGAVRLMQHMVKQLREDADEDR